MKVSHANEWWLKQKRFSVTCNLEATLTDNPPKTVPARDVCYILNKLVVETKKSATHHGMWVNVSSKYFMAGVRNYRPAIDWLVTNGIIEVNELYSPIAHFTKSYRITKDAWASGITTIDFRVKRVRAVKDRTTYLDAKGRYIRECLNQLEVIPHDSLDNREDSALRCIRYGAANVTRPKAKGRVFHAFLKVPRSARHYVRHKDGSRLAEYDFKQCFPRLLVTLYGPNEPECERYLAFCNGPDLYDRVARETNTVLSAAQLRRLKCETQRNGHKKEMMRFMQGRVKNHFYRFYLANFPVLTGAIMQRGKTLARYLQDMEASIVIDNVLPQCIERKLYFAPCHDGYLGKVSEGDIIKSLMAQATKDITGYEIPLTVKELVEAKEYKTPSYPLSHVTHKEVQQIVTNDTKASVRYDFPSVLQTPPSNDYVDPFEGCNFEPVAPEVPSFESQYIVTATKSPMQLGIETEFRESYRQSILELEAHRAVVSDIAPKERRARAFKLFKHRESMRAFDAPFRNRVMVSEDVL